MITDLETIKGDIKKILSKIVEVDEGKIKEDANLIEDLGADSMMALEVMAALEKKYNITIPEEDLVKMATLKDIVGLVSSLTKG